MQPSRQWLPLVWYQESDVKSQISSESIVYMAIDGFQLTVSSLIPLELFVVVAAALALPVAVAVVVAGAFPPANCSKQLTEVATPQHESTLDCERLEQNAQTPFTCSETMLGYKLEMMLSAVGVGKART
jgi:hypothetical protein